MRIVVWAEKRRLLLASCCKVEVMNGGLGRRTYGFRSTRATRKAASRRREASPRAVASSSRSASQAAVGPEVASLRDALAVDRDQAGGVALRVERREQVPPLGRPEGHPLAFALDDQPGRNGLHAAGRQPAHDLLPEDGRDLVAVEAIEDPARLLRIDQPLV